jgi:tetratricopeptide (TPR) repeat protein
MISANRTQVNNRYVLLDWIGAGGMGVVYRAMDRLTQNHVALKRVTAAVDRLRFAGNESDDTVTLTVDMKGPKVGAAVREGLLVRLAREFQVLSSLRHPNIISVLDYGFDANRHPFYTMELMDRCVDLKQAAALAPKEGKVELLVEVLRALMYLHRRGVIHRDLKPKNILVGEYAKLLDFGLAIKGAGQGQDVAGTITHMAPELFQFQPPSEASDLYAVGIMAYEMFAGAHPFAKTTMAEMNQTHLDIEADVSKLNANPALQAVVGKLLRKNPQDRYTDAAKVIEDLSSAMGYAIASETQATRASFLERAEFVDRVDERSALLHALESAARGKGGMVLLEGQSGIGKSRLLDELRSVALAEGLTVVVGQASGHGAVYHLWREPLRTLALTTPLEAAETSLLKLLLPDLDELTESAVPPLSLPPQAAQGAILSLIRSVFERYGSPLLLLIEDLHREPESMDVLEELARVIHRLPILMVASYRGEEAPWMAGALVNAARVHLAPFEKADIASLARSIVGRRGDTPRIVDFLEHHTEGNAFFIVETLRALAEQAGELSRVGEGPLPEHIVAAGVESLVAYRIALAPEKFRPMLEYAVLLGREPDLKVLESLLGRETVYDGLTACMHSLLLEVRSGTWRFSHDKFRETLLRQIGPERAPALHQAVAEAITKIYPDSEDHYVALAYHFGMAGDTVQETRYATLAGRTAIRQGGYKSALALLSRALELLRAQPEPDETAILELLQNLGSVQIVLYGWAAPEVRRTYDEVIEIGKRTRQEGAVAPALVGLSKFYFLRGELASAQNLARRCLELGEASGDPVIRQHGLLLTGEPGVWLGEFQKDQTYADEIAKLYDPSQAPLHLSIYGQNPRLAVASTIGTWMLGYPDRALALSREAIALAQAEKNRFSEAIACQIGGWIHQLRREPQLTQEHANRLAEISSENGFVSFQLLAQVFEGWVQARGTAAREGVVRIQEAIKRWRELGATLALTYYFAILGDACLAAGAEDEGWAAVQEGLEGKVGEERCYHSELYRLQAEFLARSGDMDKAREGLKAALAVAAEQGAKSFELRILTTWFRILPPTHREPEMMDRHAQLCAWLQERGRTVDLAAAQRFLTAGSTYYLDRHGTGS